jgi:uncharacterized protein GlcG (DUF336 family)
MADGAFPKAKVSMNITLAHAQEILEAAQAAAAATGVSVTIAVLDGAAHLKVFVRMDNAVLGSIDIALKKAKTAVLFGMASEEVREFSKPGAPSQWLEATNGVLVTFAGGIPFKNAGGEVVGAIGVSGGSVEQDRSVAAAGAAAATLNLT